MKKRLMLFLAVLMICQATTTHAAEVKLTASDAVVDDNFSTSVSISGDWAIVSSHHDNRGAGSAYIYQRDEELWKEQGKVNTKDGDKNDSFGFSVAISGDTVIAGMPQDDDDGADSGAVYVFVRNETTWTEEAKLTASDKAAGDIFGSSVSIDGDYAIVGALWNDDAGNRSGSAYIYKRRRSSWKEQAKLTASDAAKVTSSAFPSPSVGTTPSSGRLWTMMLPAQPMSMMRPVISPLLSSCLH